MADIVKMIDKLKGMPSGLARYLEKWVRKLPSLQKEIDSQTESMIDNLQSSVKPYKGKFNTYSSLPEQGRPRAEILSEIEEITALEEVRWKGGYVSGAVYHGDSEHIDFLNQVYSLQSQNNPLHSDLFPSASKFESEIVSMTAKMLGADQTKDDICGVVSSGGTESILLAIKTYRDKARELNNIYRPNIVLPVTAHAAFDKAGEYFNIKTKFIRQSELKTSGKGNELILEICKKLGARKYISGPGGKNYLNENDFKKHNIEIVYLTNSLPMEYPQLYPKVGFIDDLSALDFILHVGPEWVEYHNL